MMGRAMVLSKTECLAQNVRSRVENFVLVFNFQRRNLGHHTPRKFCAILYVVIQAEYNSGIITGKYAIIPSPFFLYCSFDFLECRFRISFVYANEALGTKSANDGIVVAGLSINN